MNREWIQRSSLQAWRLLNEHKEIHRFPRLFFVMNKLTQFPEAFFDGRLTCASAD